MSPRSDRFKRQSKLLAGRAHWAIACCLCTLLLWSLALADVDLADFNDDVMRTMGETIKALEADLAANDVRAATADVSISQQGLQYAEDYFNSKGNAADAVGFARSSHALSDEIMQALTLKDFQRALVVTQDLSRSCERCHNVYKQY
jgi:hypothetical protein